MEFIEFNTLLPTAGVIITLGTAWLTIRKIARDSEKTRKEQAADILQQAKEEISLKEKDLEAKIAAANQRIETLEKTVEKDLAYFKESYQGEIKNLADKIEDLREDIRTQHMKMIELLTKMINKE